MTVDDITRRDVAMILRPPPEKRHDHEDEGIDDDRIGQREEAIGADGVDQRRDGDDSIGGVKVAADEEPGDPGAEGAATEVPFVDMSKGLRPAPARRDKTHDGHERQKEDEDGERGRIDISHHGACSGRRSMSGWL